MDYIGALKQKESELQTEQSTLDTMRAMFAEPVEHGIVGEVVAGLGRGALRVIGTPANLADIAGEAIGWEGLEKAGEAGAEAIEQYIQESPKLRKSDSISGNILENPQLWTDPRWYLSIAGEGVPTIASMVIPGTAAAKIAQTAGYGLKGIQAARIAGGLSAAMGLEAGGAAEQIRQHEKQTGKEIPTSDKLFAVMGTGIVAGSLEYVPIFKIFGKEGGKRLVSRILSGMALEGSTEGAQELVANAFAKVGYEPDQKMVDGVIESVVGGVLLGGGMGAVSKATNFKERIDETNPDEVSTILEKAENEIEKGIVEEPEVSIESLKEALTAKREELKLGKALTEEEILQERKRAFEQAPIPPAEASAQVFEEALKEQEVLMRKFQPSPKEVTERKEILGRKFTGKERILAKVQEVKDQKLQARTITEGIFGTKEGQAFKNKGSASLNKVRMAKDHGVEFEPVEVEGGWGLRQKEAQEIVKGKVVKEVAPEKAVKEPEYITPEEALASKQITKKQYEKIKYGGLTQKQHEQMTSMAIEHNKLFQAMSQKVKRGEPLDVSEVLDENREPRFTTGIPEGYKRVGDKFVKTEVAPEKAEVGKEPAGIEKRWLIDSTNKQILELSDLKDETRFEPSVTTDITKHMGKDVIDIHTHPDNAFPSAEDWSMLAFGHAKEVKVILSDGTVVSLKKPKDFKLTPRQIKDKWEKIENDIFDSGRSLKMEADEIIHEINNKLSDETGIKITTEPISIYKGEEWAKDLIKVPAKKAEAGKEPLALDKIKYKEGGDAVGKEYHGYVTAYDAKNKKIGTVDYSYFNGKTAVKMIEVEPEYRRQGVATRLLEKLQEGSKTPIEIQGTFATKEGQALFDKFKAAKPQPAASPAEAASDLAGLTIETKPIPKPTPKEAKVEVVEKAKFGLNEKELKALKIYNDARDIADYEIVQTVLKSGADGYILNIKMKDGEIVKQGTSRSKDELENRIKDWIYTPVATYGKTLGVGVGTKWIDLVEEVDIAKEENIRQAGLKKEYEQEQYIRRDFKKRTADVAALEYRKKNNLVVSEDEYQKALKAEKRAVQRYNDFYSQAEKAKPISRIDEKFARNRIKNAIRDLKRELKKSSGRSVGKETTLYEAIKFNVSDLREQGDLDENTIKMVGESGLYDAKYLKEILPEYIEAKPAEKPAGEIEPTKEDIEAFIKPLHRKYYLEGQKKGIVAEKLNAYGALQINKLVGSKLRAYVDIDAVKQYLKEKPAREVPKYATKKVVTELEQEAQKYNSAKEFESAYSVRQNLIENNIPINKDGTVTLYHATLTDRAETIKKEGIIKGGSTATGGMTGLALKPSAFFGVDKNWVKETWGQGLDNVIEVKVPYQDIRQPAQNKKEVYFEDGLKLVDKDNNIWKPISKPRDTFYNKLPAKDYNFLNPDQKLSDIWNKAQKELPKYATKQQISDSEINLQQVRDIFKSPSGLSKDGNIWVRLKSGYGFQVKSVTHISENKLAFETARGRMRLDGELIAGKFEDDTIEIVKGIGDKWTLYHESEHLVEKAGLITPHEINVLKFKIRQLVNRGEFKTQNEKDIGGQEDRAYFIEKELQNRAKYKGTIRTILDKIADFIDSLVNLFTTTSRGITRAFESGKIFQREAGAETSGINQFAQDVSFSLKKAIANIRDNPKFNKWFKKSAAVDEDGNPVVGYHSTSGEDFSVFSFDNEYGAIFFSDNAYVAGTYPGKEKTPATRNKMGFIQTVQGQRIYPAYMSLQNPMVVHPSENYDDKAQIRDINKAKRLGHDGVIFKDIQDTELYEPFAPISDVYAVFEPTQIKSIFNTEFDPTNPDIRYAMAGKKAIGAPTGQLAKAQEMLKEGKSEKEVWKETGWLKGAEKEETWKWEIDDSGAKLKDLGLGKQIHKLSDVLEHKKLYEAYPQLKEIRIHSNLDPKDTFTSGSYFHGEGLEGKILSRNRIMLDGNPKKAEETLFHEIAHAIQEIEGFAKGLSPSEMAFKTAFKDTALIESYREAIDNYDKTKEGIAVEQEIYKWLADNKDYTNAQLKIEENRLKEKYPGYSTVVSAMEEIQRQNKLPKNATEAYHNLAGEIEARDTSARAKLTAEERREIMPYEAQGIPREAWIVIDGKGTSFSIETKGDTLEQEALKYDSAEEFVDSFGYFRRTNTESPFRDVNYAMFTEDKESIAHYGKNLFVPDTTGKYNFVEVDAVSESFREQLLNPENEDILDSYRQGIIDDDGHTVLQSAEETAQNLSEGLDTEDIVSSAGIFDSPELFNIFWEAIEDKGIDGIYTSDGMIVLNEEAILKESKLTDIWNKAQKEQPKYATKEATFQDTLAPITEDDYIANRKDSKSIKLSALTNIKRIKSEILEGVDKYLGAISTRLGNVSLKLKAKMRRLDFDINTKYASAVKTVEPMLRKAKKMSKEDFADWDYARKNSDVEKVNELIAKYDMQKEYDAYRKVLDSIREEGIDVGLEIGEIEEYAPRILKDSRGFLTAIGKAEEWPIYSRRLQEKAAELGITVAEMTPDMKATIIANMISGGWSGLGAPTSTKERKLKKIPAYLNKFYMDSDAALMQHLYSMRKNIEARKFFGKIPEKVAEMRKRLHTTQANIREINTKLKDNPENADVLKKRRNKLIGLEKQYTAYIEKYALQRDYKENIGTYVMELINNKEIAPENERIVNEILNARFHEEGTRGIIRAYKNISYIDTMGSPVSALTQIGDLAWSMYEGGVIRTLKYAYRSLRGESRITKEDVGVERIAQEFADSGTLGNAVSKVFKIVGLEKIDSIGKESLMNSALEMYQKRAKANPTELKKQIQPIFEGETDSVIEDLNNNEITDNIKLLVYSRLLDFQPVGLSEMPQKYLDAGNGRLFYMLKTFTIKVFDVFRNESYNKIKNGNKAEKIQGMKNLVKLAMFFVLANAGADELKDLLLGRKTDLEDRVVDNMLRLFGVSKFVTWKARTEGVGSALIRQVLFPVKFIDSAGKDIITAGDEKGLEVIGSIPVVGKLAYWHMGRGVSKRDDLWDRRLKKHKAKLNDIKDKLESTKNKLQFMQKHSKELAELKRLNKFQGGLNVYRKRINKLKSMEDTKIRSKSIQRLEKQRTEMIKRYLEKE